MSGDLASYTDAARVALEFCLVDLAPADLRPVPVRGVFGRVARSDNRAAASRPRRETVFRLNVRLLTEKGLTPTEIAREIGSTPNSVRVTLHRMRQLDRAA